MRRVQVIPLGIAVSTTLIGLAALTACSAGNESAVDRHAHHGVMISLGADNSRFQGAELPDPYRMPNLTLTADNDQPFNLVTDTAYPVTLVFYGYTNCPDVCPLVLSDLASAYLHLSPAARSRTQVLFITTDPARDTPSVLRGYLARFNPNFLGLTGRLATITSAAEDMGVPITGTQRLPGGGYDVGHGAQVIGFRGDRAPVIWTGGTSVPDMVSDIEILAG